MGAALLCATLWCGPARAVLDVDDRGPVLDAGNFRMRVTNAGIIGNAFYNVGRSSDPSFEYPAYSGIELLNHAELWVGGVDVDGDSYVSGGPMLEWRPTLDPNDRVLSARHDRLGSRRLVDDDGDGRVDEEVLNGKDDDGDGEVDEDLGFFADQVMASDYTDDRPEAVNYGYPTGETHHPLGLSVHQECYAWSAHGYDGIAGLSFHITNHGDRTLRNLYLGIYADLDSRLASDPTGHRNDRVQMQGFSVSKFEGTSRLLYQGAVPCGAKPCPPPPKQCFSRMSGSAPVVFDGAPGSGLGAIALMPLDHTVDPLGRILPDAARAPATVSFHSAIFDAEGIPGEGGPPVIDRDRYAAMQGDYPSSPADRAGDWTVLVSCGPFASLGPGQSLDLTMALVAAPSPDSLEAAMERAALMFIGTRLDTIPNETTRLDSIEYTTRLTGIAGHEVCLEAPPGFDLFYDPDCSSKMSAGETIVEDNPIHYPHDHCIWTDADCDECTGLHGQETILRWLDPGEVSPGPTTRVIAGDHEVTVEWDNLPEVLIQANQVGLPGSQFVAYRVYKLANWRNRQSLMPPEKNWALVGTYGSPSGNGETPLASITDTSIDYQRILFESKLYPVGRYRIVDHEVLDGFDYVYVVTTVHYTSTPLGGGVFQRILVETPLMASFDDRVTPHTAATAGSGGVTVVPNPFRASAGWDRGAVFGDPLPRHIDFMHLPRARSTIKIYTVAGDFVAQIDHDGRNGDGQASWDLISRNGQDVESGIYLFTVESPLGHQVGKFVVIR